MQYLALFVVLGTQIVRLILYMTEVAYMISETTLNLWTYTALGVGVALLLVSYLFPKKKQSA
ncbi:hypothetical protein CSV71_05455 [Sporosarcina sp. P21c]|nr:hypothetical protein SporoP8_01985 [Sporosarcina ureae]PIC66212.1 hypothetical protein CSV78_13645 [Sporosarcina sp. P16a]PIC82888.1 hypothetical protein CSV73_10570 [Sporosarcina sp. P1]PIC90151.1 hypothetical protein CSV71_05455 [Sporosarcina sp. P21c]PIC91894.1 hypothetical protein CSV70_13415 [Sporosarcina sp. P25]